MDVKELADILEAKVLTQAPSTGRAVLCGYACDLLSWVMAHGEEGMAWVTVQTHLNVIAVASLADMACVILPEGIDMEEESLTKAVTEGMVIEIKRAFPVVINRGRNRTVIYMVAGTVGDALDIAGIELKDGDQVFPSVTEFISGGSEITLIITEKKYETEYVKIPFGTKYIKHKKGNKTEAEESEGMAGIEKITYLVTYVNDVPTEKKIVQRETIIEPIDEIRYK